MQNVDPPISSATHVVCVGSSAGGLEALSAFLRGLPIDLPYCYLIAQHAAPSRDSPLSELLSRATDLPVRAAHDGMTVEAGDVLVAPASTDMAVEATTVRLSRRDSGAGPGPAVDTLLTSAAQNWGAATVGVVLSGTGHDGAAGVRAVHAAGGTTIAQQPDSAGFPGMPRAAVATGAVDLVLPPSEIGPALRRLTEESSRPGGPRKDRDGPRTARTVPVGSDRSGAPEAHLGTADADDTLEQVVIAVRAATGLDFTGYRRTALRRQIERRMRIRQVTDVGVYRDAVAESREEARTLATSMLVPDTAFFRDPRVWHTVESALRELVSFQAQDQLRVWVPGCATGPEAYSLGMTIAEMLGNPDDLPRRLKIFATDLNEDALQTARNGRYPDAVVEPVPHRMRDRWLRQDGDVWEVAPTLRDCLVFGRHDVALDPPFPHIQLVSLRNTLVYLEPPTRERVLRLVHFSLVPRGLLLLGEPERITDTHQLFATVDAEARIYRRRPATAGLLPTPRLRPAEPTAPVRGLDHPGSTGDGRDALRDALVRRLVPPTLVLDANEEVVGSFGDVSPWCRLPEGRYGPGVVALLRKGLRDAVRGLLVRVRQPATDAADRSLVLHGGEVLLSARRLGEDGHVLLSFSDPAEAPTSDEPRAAGTPPSAHGTGSSRDEGGAGTLPERGANEATLRATIDQLRRSNDQLLARNANLERRDDDLTTACSNLESVQVSLASGLVIVDRDMRVMRYTPLAVRLFALIESDVGRSLTVIPRTMEMPDLEERLRAAIHDRRAGLLELHDDRADVLVHLRPHDGAEGDGGVRGAIVMCTDITEVSAAHRITRDRLRDLVALTEVLPEALWQRAEDGRLLFLNSRVEPIFGVPRQRVLSDPELLLGSVHPSDRARVAQASTGVPDTPLQLQYRVLRPDGEQRWVQQSVVPVPAHELRPGYAVVSAVDITERHETQRHAADHLASLEAVFDNGVFGVLVLDAQDRVARANEVVARMSGFTRSALVGMPAETVTYEVDAIDTDDDAVPVIDTEPRTTLGLGHRRLIAKDGTPYLVEVETRTLDHPAGKIVIVHDVSRLHETNDALARRARFDQQTGLLSRAHFRARLATELARADRPIGVLWIDMDGFKQVNDRYGHQSGDMVLREVAARLQQLIRRHDAVGRLGGDEFAVLITDVDQTEGLEPVAQRVLEALRVPIQLRESSVHLSGSVGVAIAPVDGDDPDTLLHNADTAMYAAKDGGHDRRVYFRAAMNRAAEERAGLRQDLAEALRERNFEMHYQPLVDIRTGEVRAVEALIRWVRDGMVVPAADFMPAAEQTGQLRAIGGLAVDLVDEDLHHLRRDPVSASLTVCLNVSPAQLEERDMPDRLLAWAPAGGLGALVIEVTEAAALARGGRAIDTLSLLGRLGVRLSIDDFGTGYSNLALLDRLRPHFIKIDRTLLVSALDEPRGEAVLRAAVQLAHALDAEVVIEGVENERLWQLARSTPADQAQGFHLGRPMPWRTLIPWLRSRS